jgi:hypothetical protein
VECLGILSFKRKVFFPKANSPGCLNLCPYVDEDPRVREVLKSGEGICLTLSSIVNRPLDLSLNSLNVRLCVLGILLSVFACSSFLECNVTIEKNQSHRLSKCLNADSATTERYIPKAR